MKKFPLFACALCAFVASAAGQSSKLRELIRTDPRFAYSETVAAAPAENVALPLFTEKLSYSISRATEESFEDWVDSKPGHHDWLSVRAKKIEARLGLSEGLSLLRSRPGPDSEFRMRLSKGKLLRYSWAPRVLSDTWRGNFRRAIGTPFARAAMDTFSF